jgi:hypothetical protein
MNINCMLCGGFFTLSDTDVCSGCSRPAHKETCGTYEPVMREGEIYIYFFCDRCNDEEWEDQ